MMAAVPAWAWMLIGWGLTIVGVLFWLLIKSARHWDRDAGDVPETEAERDRKLDEIVRRIEGR